MLCCHRFWVACAASIPFCYNVAFLLPAMVIALSPAPISKLWSICRNMFARMAPLQKVVVIAAIAGILLVLNDVVHTVSGAEARETYWGNKYNVFPVGKDFLESLIWYAKKTWHLIRRGKKGVLAEYAELCADACRNVCTHQFTKPTPR